MKFKMFSVIVGTEACIASCPFCVSGVTPNCENMKEPKINWRNLDIACNLANRSGIDTVMLTSRGEPTLFPDQISEYLKHLAPYKFPFVELQSNCIPLALNHKKYDKYLKEWYTLGMTTITISVVSEKKEINQKVYTPNGEYINLAELIEYLHGFGFSLRLTCVMCNGFTDTPEKVQDFINFAKQNKVEQVTLRPVNDEYRRQSAHDWVAKNKLTEEQKDVIRKHLADNGTKLLDLERIGSIYDVNGQNVCLSLPLNKYTRDTNPDNLRNLIFFQDGHLRYEWEMEGGILLWKYTTNNQTEN